MRVAGVWLMGYCKINTVHIRNLRHRNDRMRLDELIILSKEVKSFIRIILEASLLSVVHNRTVIILLE